VRSTNGDEDIITSRSEAPCRLELTPALGGDWNAIIDAMEPVPFGMGNTMRVGISHSETGKNYGIAVRLAQSGVRTVAWEVVADCFELDDQIEALKVRAGHLPENPLEDLETDVLDIRTVYVQGICPKGHVWVRIIVGNGRRGERTYALRWRVKLFCGLVPGDWRVFCNFDGVRAPGSVTLSVKGTGWEQ